MSGNQQERYIYILTQENDPDTLALLIAKPVNVRFFPLIINGNGVFTLGLEKIAAKLAPLLFCVLFSLSFFRSRNQLCKNFPNWTIKCRHKVFFCW